LYRLEEGIKRVETKKCLFFEVLGMDWEAEWVAHSPRHQNVGVHLALKFEKFCILMPDAAAAVDIGTSLY